MQRRRALQLFAALAGIPALPALHRLSDSELLALGARVHERLGEEPGGVTPRALTPAQYRMVATAAEHIIPRTDTPGATDARVSDFVDVMLADWYSTAERDRFLAGLADLDARATRAHGRAFEDAGAADRTALLQVLDTEVATLRRTDPRSANEHWFAMLKFLTGWGYYTSRAGMTEELQEQFLTGRYDGDAPVPVARRNRPPGTGQPTERPLDGAGRLHG